MNVVKMIALGCVSSALFACGGGTDSHDSRDYADAGVNADATHADSGNNTLDSGRTRDDAGASSSGHDSGSAGNPPGQCAPGNACGGLTQCTDYCYGSRCCLLNCSCGANDTLGCDLLCN